jgi:hypothetical protein
VRAIGPDDPATDDVAGTRAAVPEGVAGIPVRDARAGSNLDSHGVRGTADVSAAAGASLRPCIPSDGDARLATQVLHIVGLSK